jgi:hypothetical protein
MEESDPALDRIEEFSSNCKNGAAPPSSMMLAVFPDDGDAFLLDKRNMMV